MNICSVSLMLESELAAHGVLDMNGSGSFSEAVLRVTVQDLCKQRRGDVARLAPVLVC